ncbi:MAG: putative drug exporter of the superfamily, partial [Mycobacterium sp.]|nr:putative drug exporter of the superfamily [Mycobacterium sp.]
MSHQHAPRPWAPHTIRRLSVPIVLFWVALAALTNIFVPNLEEVGKAHNVSLSSPDAASLQAQKHIGQVFHEFHSDSAAMVLLEGEQPLGDKAHRFYDVLVRKLKEDTKHVEHIQDFW